MPAEEKFQAACERAGGRNWLGMPHFRLVWAESRFCITGDREVHFYDVHGNYRCTRPETVMVARYNMPTGFEHCYLLEAWHDPEWYEEQGFERGAVDWSQVIRGLARMDPITQRGGYEAVEMEMDMPIPFFPRWTYIGARVFPPMTTRMIEWAIRRYRQSSEYSARLRAALRADQRRKEEQREFERLKGGCIEAMGPHPLEPHIYVPEEVL